MSEKTNDEPSGKNWPDVADKGLEISKKMGPFVERVFGGLVENGVGIVSDRLKYLRIKQAFGLNEKVTDILRERGITETKPVKPYIGLKIIENAALEEDETLHTLWAELLASAMSPKELVKKRSVAVLEQLDVEEAEMLKNIIRRSDLKHKQSALNDVDDLSEIQLDHIRRLCELGLLGPVIERFQYEALGRAFIASQRAEKPTFLTMHSWQKFYVTPFGWQFAEAVGLLE